MGAWKSIGETHRAAGLVAQVDADAEEVGGAGGFAALAAHAIFRAGGGSDLASLAAVPGNHLENIEGASPHALGATDAGVVDLDGVGHGKGRAQTAWRPTYPWPPQEIRPGGQAFTLVHTGGGSKQGDP